MATEAKKTTTHTSWRMIWLRFGGQIIVISLIVFCLIAYFAVIGPLLHRFQTNRLANQKQKQDIVTLESRQTQLKQEEQRLLAWQPADIGLLEQVVPSKSRKDDLYIGMDSLVRSLGFEIVELRVEEQKIAPSQNFTEQTEQSTLPSGIAPLKISLQVKNGGYQGYKALLKKLEQYTRLLRIESFRLSGKGTDGQSSKSSGSSGAGFSVVMTAYYAEEN